MSAPFERTRVPGIYKRGCRYTFPYRTPRGKRRWATAATIAEAQRKRAAIATDVARGEYAEEARETFETYARRWVATYTGRTSRGLQEQTREDYAKRLEQDAIPFFEGRKLAEIRPLDVKELAAHVASRGVTQNTVRLALAPVKALFATAFEEGAIRANPAAGVRVFVTTNGDEADDDVKALTEEGLVALLNEVPAEWRLFFDFLAQTGLRIGEAIELRWRDVDLGEGTILVRRSFYRGRVGKPKSRYGHRRLRLTEGTSRRLWSLRKSTRAGDAQLVFTSEKGVRVDPSNLMSRVLKPAAFRAGLGEWPGFHTFRHTCATMLFRQGWNAVQVQRWLGHHKASFTIDTYVHLLKDDLPDPGFLDALTAGQGVNSGVNSTPREEPKAAVTAGSRKGAVSRANTG